MRVIILGFVILCSVAVICGGMVLYLELRNGGSLGHVRVVVPVIENPPAPSTLPHSLDRVLIDVDSLANRMKSNRDIYQKIRDAALADYDKRNPDPKPYDDRIRTLLRLFAYLWVWGDFYREGLWLDGYDYANAAQIMGSRDPALRAFRYVYFSTYSFTDSEEETQKANQSAEQFLATGYPTAFKLWVCSSALDNFAKYRTRNRPDPDAVTVKAMPTLVEKWGKLYRQLLQDKLPHSLLYDHAEALLDSADEDEETLNHVIGEQDRDFNESDPANPVRMALDGSYYVHAAWNARGNGWANSVSEHGWELFRERLDKAAEILEAAYDRYPKEGEIARKMISVELGQGQGKDRMELWFQRAIKADPDDFDAYTAKEWYLQPRWYGSVDEVIGFGQECIQTENWSAKLPLVFSVGVADAAGQDWSFYTKPEIWTPLEKSYLDFLDHFPNSVFYRTNFAYQAYEGGHFDVARKQFHILGSDWDRTVISEASYRDISRELHLW